MCGTDVYVNDVGQRFYLVPLYLYPSLHTVACQLLCDAVGGAYLGVNFIISHNYEGVRTVLSDADRSKHVKRDWAFEQVSGPVKLA